jgi:hypothetical protein
VNTTLNDLGRIAGSVARQLNAGASRVDVDGAQCNSGHPVRAVLHVTTTVGLAIAVAVMAVKLSEQGDLRRQAETQVREIAVARAANIGAEQQQAGRAFRAALAARMGSAGSATSNGAALTAPGAAPGSRDRDFQQQLRKQLADPALRSAFRAQQRAAVLQLYGDLLRSWHLPADKSDRLLDLLAEQQLQEMEQSFKTLEPGSAAVARASDDAATSASKDEINALLTDQQRKELQYQQDSLNERLTVGSLADELSLAQMPLTDSQREQLTHAMVDERNAVSRPDVSNMPANSPDAQGALEDWQSALDQRVQDRAATILTSAQQSRYEQFMTRQREASSAFASFEVAQSGDNAGGATPPTATSP